MKLLTIVLLLSSVSAPALAELVSTAPAAKKCELGGNKPPRFIVPTAKEAPKKSDESTRANS